MDSLISFDGFADVCNNFINKISDATGWIANHKTPARIAADTYIQEIQNSNYDPLTKAALISNAKKAIKEYCNQNNIIKTSRSRSSNDCTKISRVLNSVKHQNWLIISW